MSAATTNCERMPGMCAHDERCARVNCPGHPLNMVSEADPAEADDEPAGLFASPWFWLVALLGMVLDACIAWALT